MSEIHDQFDTIVIFDFGSQVCFFFFFALRQKKREKVVSDVISVVQPFDNKKM